MKPYVVAKWVAFLLGGEKIWSSTVLARHSLTQHLSVRPRRFYHIALT